MKAKVSKSLNTLLQVLILVVAYGFLYREFVYKRDLGQLLNLLLENLSNRNFLIMLSAALALMAINLGLEAWKWKFMIDKFEHVSFIQSVKAVFSGITVSLFTPNRVGDYFGRVFILKQLHPVKGALVTIIGSMGQLLATILTGLVSLLFFLPRVIDIRTAPNHYFFIGILIATVFIIILLVILYLNFSFVTLILEKIIPRRWEKVKKYIQVFEEYKPAELAYVLFISLLRYAIFTTQFIILLYAFGVNLPLPQMLVVIPMIFFLITIIPTVALSELGIRGSVSIKLFGLYFAGSAAEILHMTLGVFTASTLLWLINLAIPAIAGTLFVFNLRFIRSNNNHPE